MTPLSARACQHDHGQSDGKAVIDFLGSWRHTGAQPSTVMVPAASCIGCQHSLSPEVPTHALRPSCCRGSGAVAVYFPSAANTKSATALPPMSTVTAHPQTFTQRGLVNRPMTLSSRPILKMKNIRIGAIVPLTMAA